MHTGYVIISARQRSTDDFEQLFVNPERTPRAVPASDSFPSGTRCLAGLDNPGLQFVGVGDLEHPCASRMQTVRRYASPDGQSLTHIFGSSRQQRQLKEYLGPRRPQMPDHYPREYQWATEPIGSIIRDPLHEVMVMRVRIKFL